MEMTPKVKSLYLHANLDIDFQEELKIHEPEFYIVKPFWGDMEKLIYTSIYLGWLIGKNQYNESNYF